MLPSSEFIKTECPIQRNRINYESSLAGEFDIYCGTNQIIATEVPGKNHVKNSVNETTM